MRLATNRKLDPGLKDSQVELLRLIAAGGDVSVFSENVHFKKHRQHGGTMEFAKWVGDLVERGLIEVAGSDTSGPSFRVTAIGRAYLGEKWMGHAVRLHGCVNPCFQNGEQRTKNSEN